MDLNMVPGKHLPCAWRLSVCVPPACLLVPVACAWVGLGVE